MADVPLIVESRSIRAESLAQQRTVGTRPFGPKSLVAYLLLIALTVYCLTPLYWLIIAATKNNTDLFASFGLWFAHFNLWQNLVDTFTYDGNAYPHWLLNSAIYAGVGGFFSMIISVLCGYALAKFKFPGRGLIFGLVLGAVLVPQTTLALPLYMVISKVGLTNSYWAVLLPSLLSPLGVFLARIFAADAIPSDLLDAAGERQANVLQPGLQLQFAVALVQEAAQLVRPAVAQPALCPLQRGARCGPG